MIADVYDELDFLRAKLKELLAQNQQMKCCANCGKTRDCKTQAHCKTENYADWELFAMPNIVKKVTKGAENEEV